MKMYAIKSSNGILLCDTAGPTRNMAWEECYFRHLYKQYDYYEIAHKAAYRKGWRCVPCRVTEIK